MATITQQLVGFAASLGRALRDLVTIGQADTLRRWIREAGKRRRTKPARDGCPGTREEIRRLIFRLAHKINWGLTRVLGELRKLGIQGSSRSTVKNTLKTSGFAARVQRAGACPPERSLGLRPSLTAR